MNTCIDTEKGRETKTDPGTQAKSGPSPPPSMQAGLSIASQPRSSVALSNVGESEPGPGDREKIELGGAVFGLTTARAACLRAAR